MYLSCSFVKVFSKPYVVLRTYLEIVVF